MVCVIPDIWTGSYSWVTPDGKECACNWETWVQIHGSGQSLEREWLPTPSYCWKPTDEPGRLYSPWGFQKLDANKQLTRRDNYGGTPHIITHTVGDEVGEEGCSN